MTKQTKITILIIVVFIVLIGGLFAAYQYFLGDSEGGFFGGGGSGNGDVLFPSNGGVFGGSGNEGEKPGVSGGVVPELRQISPNPTSGSIAFAREEATVIRYVDRATGHVFETTRDSLEQTRLSNTTVPRVQEALWHPEGEEVILRYLDENGLLRSFYGEISGTGSLNGTFLRNNISALAVHDDGDLFFIQRIGSGSEGVRADFDGANPSSIFSSEIRDWRASWGGNSLFLTTKAANSIEGFLFRLRNGSLERELAGNGLVTNISPDGSRVLFSMSEGVETALFIFDRSSGETATVPFRTIADKCSWATDTKFYCGVPYAASAGALYPDDWYAGAVSLSDDIWSFDTLSGIEQLVYDAEAAEVSFDAMDLRIDEEERVLLFTDKNNLSLWALSLN